jgi:hypothetical protein
MMALIAYTGSGPVGSGFFATKRNFHHFRSIKERELVYVFSVSRFILQVLILPRTSCYRRRNGAT